jgi:hypothetical protein
MASFFFGGQPVKIKEPIKMDPTTNDNERIFTVLLLNLLGIETGKTKRVN